MCEHVAHNRHVRWQIMRHHQPSRPSRDSKHSRFLFGSRDISRECNYRSKTLWTYFTSSSSSGWSGFSVSRGNGPALPWMRRKKSDSDNVAKSNSRNLKRFQNMCHRCRCGSTLNVVKGREILSSKGTSVGWVLRVTLPRELSKSLIRAFSCCQRSFTFFIPWRNSPTRPQAGLFSVSYILHFFNFFLRPHVVDIETERKTWLLYYFSFFLFSDFVSLPGSFLSTRLGSSAEKNCT